MKRSLALSRPVRRLSEWHAIDRRSWFCGVNSAQTLGFVLLLAIPSVAHGQRVRPAVHTEVRRIVDAFLGHWTLTGRSTKPGVATPSLVTGTINCESAVGGMAVHCRVVNAVTGGGQIEIATIVGYSPDDHRVHLMEAASVGLYHEHRGRWNGNVIHFERLTKSVDGKRIVEDFAIGFPSPGTMTITSIERAAEGRSTLDLVGTRELRVR